MPPKWIVEPEDQSVILGNSVIIPCEANGSPPPTLLWKQAIGKKLARSGKRAYAHCVHIRFNLTSFDLII